jgi:AraC family transcriptional regulator, regulatory protein of adaptative response / methylated-DNA-[protein]-cysteine methyltransferase
VIANAQAVTAAGVLPMLDSQTCWTAVQNRDRAFDGRFVFAVSTTGVYCRPSCAARRPLERNTRFFAAPAAAEAAGFRACRRCHPREAAAGAPSSPNARKIAELCDYLRAQAAEGDAGRPAGASGTPLGLAALGRRAGMSPAHLQRTFRAIVGVSPRQYLEACRLEILKERLRSAPTVTDAIYEAGYGSSSRVYEDADSRLGMTPRQYRSGGAAVTVSWTVLELPELAKVGLLLVGATDRGLCSVALGRSRGELQERLRKEFPAAELRVVQPPYTPALKNWIGMLRAHLRGQPTRGELPLDLRATAFRFEVWRYLRSIPKGQVRTYSEVAAAVGRPRAARAVASACAANPVALVIPCHRVLRADGGLGGYRWGVERKRRLLDGEGAARPAGR